MSSPPRGRDSAACRIFRRSETKALYTKFAVGQYGVPSTVTDIAVYDLATGVESMTTHQGVAVQGTWVSWRDADRVSQYSYAHRR